MTRIAVALVLTTFLAPAAVSGQAPASPDSTPAVQTPPVQTPPPAQTPPPTQTTPPGQKPAPPLPVPQAAKPPAPPAPFPADAKIGLVSLQAVVAGSRMGKIGQEQLKKLSDQRKVELDAQQKKIEGLRKEIQDQAAVLLGSALTAKQAQLDKLQREFQFAQDQANADLNALNTQLLEAFEDKVLPIIEALRAEKSLWFIIAVQNVPPGEPAGSLQMVSYQPGLDLTQEVIRRLDAATPGTPGK
jgi:Skp family chaperone for outer membrane proteins